MKKLGLLLVVLSIMACTEKKTQAETVVVEISEAKFVDTEIERSYKLCFKWRSRGCQKACGIRSEC